MIKIYLLSALLIHSSSATAAADIHFVRNQPFLSEIGFEKNSWIEINTRENSSASCIKLEDYQIEIAEKKISLNNPELENPPFCVFKIKEKISDNQSEIVLKKKSTIIDRLVIDPKKAPSSAQSLARAGNILPANSPSDWRFFLHSTKGRENHEENSAPQGKISYKINKKKNRIDFSSKNSFDPDSDPLKIKWIINGKTFLGEKIAYKVLRPWEEQDIELTVEDIFFATSKATLRLDPLTAKKKSTREMPEIQNLPSSGLLEINEIFANPESADKGKEWIELFNPGKTNLNLQNWYIVENHNAKEKIEKIAESRILNGGEYLTIDLKKISLPNSAANLKLISPNGFIADEIHYPEVKEGLSYSKIATLNRSGEIVEKKWEFSEHATPESQNIFFQEFQGEIKNLKVEEGWFLISGVGNEIKINYQNLNTLLAAQTFQIGNKIQLLAEVIENHYFLKNFKILETAQKSPPKKLPLLKTAIAIAGLIFSFIYFRRRHCQSK